MYTKYLPKCSVAQLVERRTPNLLPVRARLRDVSALDISSLLTGCGRGSGRSQLKSVSGADRARLCGHVKLSFLNSADYQEYPDRKVGTSACATSSAYCGLCPRQSFHSKGSDKINPPPLGYFYNAPHWGGAISSPPPPLISETTGPILKIQAAFESPGKTVEGKQILLTSGSRVTSQVRSKSKCSTFRAWWHRRAKLRCYTNKAN